MPYHAHVFEHADRDDAVVEPGFLAVVAQRETHARAQPLRFGTGACHLELLGRQRQPGHVHAVMARQIQRQAAPAAADVEHAQAGLQQEFCGDMAFLQCLSLLQGFVAAWEIGAGILPVAVEKEVVERVGQVVVMGDVAVRAPRRVELVQPAQGTAHRGQEPLQRHARDALGALVGQGQKVAQGALLHGELAIHVGLASGQFGMQQQPSGQSGIAQPDRHFGSAAGTEAMGMALRIDECQPTLGQRGVENAGQQHDVPPGAE